MPRKKIIALSIFITLVTNSFSYSQKIENDTITIFSWNIKLLPKALISVKHFPLKRVPHIVEKMISSNYDVIVFQEAFDKAATSRLKEGLRYFYPYQIGPANQKGAKLNSGVMIVSKYPIKELGSIEYKDCSKINCMSRKGALLGEIEVKGHTIQVSGTHLDANNADVRVLQYEELRNFVQKYAKNGIPQFHAGDYNTNITDSVYYPKMMQMLGWQDGPLSGPIQITFDNDNIDMSFDRGGKGVLDYIFYVSNGVEPLFVSREVLIYQHTWKKNFKDLSDHYGVLMKIVLPKKAD